MITFRRLRSFSAVPAFAALLLVAGCKEKSEPTPFDAGVVAPPPDTGPTPVDITQCPGCQLAPQPSWTFNGVFRDASCTEPLAQIAPPACAAVPALESASLSYAEDVGSRKANEIATVTLTEQIPPTATRYRKSGTKCVPANESAVDLTPLGCSGSRVCRDTTGMLTCGENCRTFADGCPDFEETRMYAAFNDPGLKGVKQGKAGGGGNLARLQQCCSALAAEAKRLGNSPEAGMVNSAAQQCTALVKAAGPSGNAPEMGVLRGLLAGRNIPPVCSGF